MRFLSGASSVTVVAVLAAVAAGCSGIGQLRARKNLKEANQAYAQQDYKKAADLYEASVKAAPDDPNIATAYFYLGNSYDNLYKPTKRGEADNDMNLAKAVENYKLAIEKLNKPEAPAPKYRKLSFEYLIAAYGADKLNDIEKAVPIAQELIAAEPNEPNNYQALGKLYEENGRYDEAEAMFKKAIEVRPKIGRAHV